MSDFGSTRARRLPSSSEMDDDNDDDTQVMTFPALRPTAIPRFDVADYARRCDESIRGSVIGAMPPLRDLALRYRTPKIRVRAHSGERMGAGFAALLQSFVAKTG